MPPKKMEVKMSALENEVAVLKLTLAEMKAQAAAEQELQEVVTRSWSSSCFRSFRATPSMSSGNRSKR